MIELRKRRIEDAMDQGGDTPALYTILPEKKQQVGGAMMGSAHVYDMSAVSCTSWIATHPDVDNFAEKLYCIILLSFVYNYIYNL